MEHLADGTMMDHDGPWNSNAEQVQTHGIPCPDENHVFGNQLEITSFNIRNIIEILTSISDFWTN